MLYSILFTFYSCNSQGSLDNAQILLKQESNFCGKTKLDSKAIIIYQDKSDNFWFASDKGVYRYDGDNLILFTSNDGLKNYRIISQPSSQGINSAKHNNQFSILPQMIRCFRPFSCRSAPSPLRRGEGRNRAESGNRKTDLIPNSRSSVIGKHSNIFSSTTFA